jgi:hypothetical protein
MRGNGSKEVGRFHRSVGAVLGFGGRRRPGVVEVLCRQDGFGGDEEFALLEADVRTERRAEGLQTAAVAGGNLGGENAQFAMIGQRTANQIAFAGRRQARQQRFFLGAEMRLEFARKVAGTVSNRRASAAASRALAMRCVSTSAPWCSRDSCCNAARRFMASPRRAPGNDDNGRCRSRGSRSSSNA